MNWIDYETYVELLPPPEFCFEECLVFLGRADHEVLHRTTEEAVYKLLNLNKSNILIRVTSADKVIRIDFLHGDISSAATREEIAAFVWEWFDLDQDLAAFYYVAEQDPILQKLAHSYFGLRIICMPDLFEALVWAILGQQINLTFAYTLKKRFVEQYGESFSDSGETYWIFPSAEQIASVEVAELRELQFSARKAEYITGIAEMMAEGSLTKETLQGMDQHELHKELTNIRGVGAWTADYVMMKCLHIPSAFPIADVGLHQALQHQLGLEQKPSIEEIQSYAVNWEGWQAYAVFYLWRSLYDSFV
ncbi:DNA-3-methyladenine glycosylase family protein [Alkalicoccobacillus porphyridii]|uniref:DNA-3-methyladenine glycosylase II n=1 Tax=Alkalicoccobacillus porphyridii TaxID=2597270 RepID=A0A554A159_9BACI|nr:DNA-3-methyladenine glycosylase [Alkalicoccobacillus porphyridii]TSB47427.1 DNA-3-methyladenine glycosylase 2 family protein [Alkalicoccobacillus porphyridii]